jgi:hypothetical protein
MRRKALEIEITKLVHSADDMIAYSASVFEAGENAGQRTWGAALASAAESPLIPLDDSEKIGELREYLAEFGAWSEQELADMSPTEVNALALQFIAGDIREMSENFETQAEYEAACDSGQASGRIYQSDSGEWFYYLGI